MARRAEEEENHWPGFVDALSTIVMVVTFLLIILVVVIVVISQQVNPEGNSFSDVTQDIQVATLEQEILKIQEVVNQQTETIEEKEQEILELEEQAEQTSVSDTGDTPQVQAETPIIETEIIVPRVDENVASQNLRSEVETANAVMTVRFEENAVELDETSKDEALSFLEENSVVSQDQSVVAISYFDGDSVSVSQAKRTAYYRLLSVRNALLDSGIDGERITISVVAAPENTDGTANINRVKVFLR